MYAFILYNDIIKSLSHCGERGFLVDITQDKEDEASITQFVQYAGQAYGRCPGVVGGQRYEKRTDG